MPPLTPESMLTGCAKCGASTGREASVGPLRNEPPKAAEPEAMPSADAAAASAGAHGTLKSADAHGTLKSPRCRWRAARNALKPELAAAEERACVPAVASWSGRKRAARSASSRTVRIL